MDLSTILIFVVTFLLIAVLQRPKKGSNIPGPRSLPIVGTLFSLAKYPRSERHLLFGRLREQYGDIFRMKMGSHMIVVICGYKLVNEWFYKKGSVLADRPNWIPSVQSFAKAGHYGIIWSNGERWKTIRRFTMQTLRDMGVGKKVLEERIIDEVNSVLKFLGNSQGNAVCLKRNMTVATSNIIHSVVFGFRYPYESEKFQSLLNHIDGLFSENRLLAPESFMPWLSYFTKKNLNTTIHREKIEIYIKEQIEEHRKTFDKDNIRDFIDLYIASELGTDEGHIDKGDFFRTIMSLFLAGTETTSSTLHWAFLYMIAYPDIQKKCQSEIDEVIGEGRLIQLSDRKNLKYTEATLMEIQRLSNIAPATLPHMPSEDVVINGYTIPKGTIVMGSLRSVHMDDDYWKECVSFNPDRFIDNNGKITMERFMPFSLGPRICPGESLAKSEMFLMFSNILHRFNLEKTEEKLNLTGVAKLTATPAPYKLRAVSRE